VIRVALALAVALVSGGCGLLAGAVGRPPDDFSGWSRVPLPPDAALDAEAQQTCRSDPAGPPLPLLFQDRRTPQSAIVVFGDADEYHACWASHGGGGGFGSGSSSVGGVPKDELTIGMGRSGVGGVTLTHVDGVLRVPAASVSVLRADGLVVEASFGGGRWLAWWPTDILPVRAIAYDATGNELARAEP
jgi:hypothetical protein